MAYYRGSDASDWHAGIATHAPSHGDLRPHRESSAFTGTARVTVLFEDGTAPVTRNFTLPASSRSNITPASHLPETIGKRFGLLIESIGGTPGQIVVERAMYSDAQGVRWAAGTNALATKLP